MPTLRVSLFGKFIAQFAETDVCSFDARKAQELFCFLLMRREQMHSREVLAGLFWGESPTAQAKKSLRQALWQMQVSLGNQFTCGDNQILLIDAEWVQINPNADLWLDVAEFERAFSKVQGQRGEELNDTVTHALRQAVDLYSGDLLEGCYQDWCIYERERLQNSYLTMLDKLMTHCETHQEYEAGIAYGLKRLRYDRAHEQTHRRLMRLYSRTGDRATALRQYQRCTIALQEELGVRPSHRTIALYEHIQLDDDEGWMVDAALLKPSPFQEKGSLISLVARLRQRWHTLVSLEHEIREDIESLELALQSQTKLGD